MTNPTKPALNAEANDACATTRMRPNGSVIGTGLVNRTARC